MNIILYYISSTLNNERNKHLLIYVLTEAAGELHLQVFQNFQTKTFLSSHEHARPVFRIVNFFYPVFLGYFPLVDNVSSFHVSASTNIWQ